MKGAPVSSNPPEIMAIGETAQYLRISQSSLYKLAQEGRIPCLKVDRHWRFRKQALDRWLATYSKIGVLAKVEGAARIARTGQSYVLTTSAGSGKSLAYIIPIVDYVMRNPG